MSVEIGQATASLTEPEREQLSAWNTTDQPFPQDTCVPQLVAAQAAANPEAVAVVSGAQTLTYRALNQRANQLAHLLQKRGVGPNTLVAACLERSIDLVVAWLGILKAGGAYVATDPTYPADRLAFLLEDARPPVLLTQQHLLPRLAVPAAQLLCLDADADLLDQQPDTEPACAITADDLVYVIYTSGSTGQPKGVQISHASLLNLIFWHQRAFDVTAASRATQVASPAFDATGWELWPYLTAGASIHLPDTETRVAPAALRDWLLAHNITHTFLPTPLAEQMLALAWPAQTSLRYMLTGGDRLQHYPPSSLPFAFINNYGPTEYTVVTTSGQVPPAGYPNQPPSLGRPIANTQLYLLDEQLQPVPIGEAGELYIGGAGLARGYLNRPELTAERFISHPFSAEPGARLYKTGDLARYLPDGQLAFLGRSDDQIKLRGYRIEPGEIVAALNQHPAIQANIVVAREDPPDEKRLVAYIVIDPEAAITPGILQEHLLASLPDYMVPAVFVRLDALPVTANGKVDRAALPAPDHTNTLREEISEEPDTPVEALIAEMVSNLLHIDKVGMDENFFMLGGHSMLGIQLVTLIGETFGVELALRTLFEAPTVRMLSTEIQQQLVTKLEAMSEDEAQHLLAQGQNHQ
ncbi:MAG TPA: non-ribosomal peptide synthetase [Ktedonobacterales bacterium]|jgi:amino acid adenylation domain-containing protein